MRNCEIGKAQAVRRSMGTTTVFQRLLEVLRPKGGPIFVLLEAYFDESGDLDAPPGVFVLAGYLLETDDAREMESEWLAALRQYDIPFFHMVDCAHGNEKFEKFSKKERIEIQTRFMSLVKKYTIEGFAFVATDDAFRDENGDCYTNYVSMAVDAMQYFFSANRQQGNILHFFESGHQSQSRAYGTIANEVIKRGDSVTFSKKKDAVLLQAADLLAWQVFKYIKDQRSGDRPPRKDFLSLMERDHTIHHWFKHGEEKIAALELWPLSKRSEKTKVLSVIAKDGPITLFTESDEMVPIIIVDESCGYRVGGLKTAQMLFRDIDKKPFFLSFNEPRLYETLINLIGSTATYKDSDYIPAIEAEDAHVIRRGDDNLLYVRLKHGGIGFSLSPEAIKQLRQELDSD